MKTLHDREHTVVLQTSFCPNLTNAAQTSSSVDHTRGLNARLSTQCTVPSPECQCGVACLNMQCIHGSSPVPSLADCSSLQAALVNLSPQAFLIDPQEMVTASLGTCAFNVINFSSGEIEYCLSDLGDSGNEVAIKCAGQGIDAGTCTVSFPILSVTYLNSVQ
ncbi:hypothetical protein PHLGIDRAFT_244695 [Phlebiopsis gigantea 11061_1 CR5-6]|uniref:Uncharacterized protein n=1 Tax=Phlebiopsis gigantea (strain 11061_1 CR5-6) TaxID=745531 RepID=A0A0C3NF87_PHLG1|nr:hypothetical protein PHLGIDRAFT_244695 [Phlebiopsis gigantea 11061_1 CR5-6]